MKQIQIIDGRFEIFHILETGSTNADLVELARKELNPDTQMIKVLVTDFQTQGKGRLDRSWEAKSGEALLVSFLIWEKLDLYPYINIEMALAALDAIVQLADEGSEIQIKWPNDLVVKDGYKKGVKNGEYKKLGGILSEYVKLDSGKDALVLGIGINIATPKIEIERAFLAPIGLQEICLAKKITDPTKTPDNLRDDLFEKIVNNFAYRHKRLIEDESEAHKAIGEVEMRLAYLGSQVEVKLPSNKQVSGKISGVNLKGHLLIETENETLTIETGDIVSLRT